MPRPTRSDLIAAAHSVNDAKAWVEKQPADTRMIARAMEAASALVVALNNHRQQDRQDKKFALAEAKLKKRHSRPAAEPAGESRARFILGTFEITGWATWIAGADWTVTVELIRNERLFWQMCTVIQAYVTEHVLPGVEPRGQRANEMVGAVFVEAICQLLRRRPPLLFELVVMSIALGAEPPIGTKDTSKAKGQMEERANTWSKRLRLAVPVVRKLLRFIPRDLPGRAP